MSPSGAVTCATLPLDSMSPACHSVPTKGKVGPSAAACATLPRQHVGGPSQRASQGQSGFSRPDGPRLTPLTSDVRTLGRSAPGVWRSLVAHSLWERGAVGSNPATPTRKTLGFRASRPGPHAPIRLRISQNLTIYWRSRPDGDGCASSSALVHTAERTACPPRPPLEIDTDCLAHLAPAMNRCEARLVAALARAVFRMFTSGPL
jgi:hypothetical protein